MPPRDLDLLEGLSGLGWVWKDQFSCRGSMIFLCFLLSGLSQVVFAGFPFQFTSPFGISDFPFPIDCPGPAPPGPYGDGSFREGYTRRTWTEADFGSSLHSLCAADSPIMVNFQGRCVVDFDPTTPPANVMKIPLKPRFSAGLAKDYGLFDENTFAICRERCSCSTFEDIMLAEDLHDAEQAMRIQRPRIQEDEDNEGSSRNNRASPATNSQTVSIVNPPSGQCPSSRNCVNNRCPQPSQNNAGRSPSCFCMARQTSVGRYRAAGCRIQAASSLFGQGRGRRKRDYQPFNFPCPCNSTYVSAACCSQADGLVWEATELKLGVMEDL